MNKRGLHSSYMDMVILGLYDPWSKLLVSALITPMILPYITPFKEFRLYPKPKALNSSFHSIFHCPYITPTFGNPNMCIGSPPSAAKRLPPRGGFPSAKSDTACFHVCPTEKSESGLGEYYAVLA